MRRLLVWLVILGLPLSPVAAAGIEPSRGLVPVPPAVRSGLEARCAALAADLASMEAGRAGGAVEIDRTLLPDVAVLLKAVEWALLHDEFQRTNDVAAAGRLLDLAASRATELRMGRASWLNATGRVVRGFVSRIDGSVQPYVAVVPPSWREAGSPVRMDIWLHGRDERLTELKFLVDRMGSDGEFAPEDAVVIHPYGRFCNAFKFAGETDVLEAMEHALRAYHGDPSRVGLRGFSMGGAGTWHLAAHFPGTWKAANPGAGFAETARYARIGADPSVAPWERTLWQMYDAPVYAAGLRHLTVLAYSGELDPQRQAADVMSEAMAAEGLSLEHLIGPGVQHRYEPGTKREVARRFDAWMAGPSPAAPAHVRFATPTLQYVPDGRLAWFRPERLGQHWRPARMDAVVEEGGHAIRVEVSNVAGFALVRPPGLEPGTVTVTVNGLPFRVRHRGGDHAFIVRFAASGQGWRRVRSAPRSGKRPGLQGPIDHAFMDGFLVVRPTGQGADPGVAGWTRAALEEFVRDWRAQFRGDVRLKDDVEVTREDIARYHLVLFGDPAGNRMIGRVAGRLPLRWGAREIRAGRATFPAAGTVLTLIAPNPLNPRKYVVLNSGHTFADWVGTNARQTPRLPDWAIRRIGKDGEAETVSAGFLDEDWEVPDGTGTGR